MRIKLISAVITLAACSVLAQETSDLRITHFDSSGFLQFTNSVVASNKSYRIEYSQTLSGDWQTDTNVLIFATNTSFQVQLNLPQNPNQLFVRVARNLFIARPVNESNVLEIITLEDGEQIGVLTNENLTVTYTASNGMTAVLYVATNGLPDRLVSGQFVFLYRNFTSNFVDVGIVWPEGSNSIVRGVPVDAVLLSRLQEFNSVSGPAVSADRKRSAKAPGFNQFAHKLVEIVSAELGLVACVGAGVSAFYGQLYLEPVLVPVCSSGVAGTFSLITSGHTAGYVSGEACIGLLGCIHSLIGPLNDRVNGAKETLEGQAVLIADTDAVCQSPGEIFGNMVHISPGTFTMGSPDGEVGRASVEGPQTQVTISREFWMGRYEVTQGEYLAVVGSNPSHFTGDLNRPVDTVSFDDALAYSMALTQREHDARRLSRAYEYRLPTEAQWEYACRAGTTTRFNLGDSDSDLGRAAWYLDNSNGTTHRVGQKEPNAWSLNDMHGNVWEWCADWFGGYPGGSVTDPHGPSTGSSHVLRGGCIDNNTSACRSAERSDRATSPFLIGFRVVLVAVQP